MNSMHLFHRFLREPTALERTRAAFERLLGSVRPVRPR